MAWKLKKRIFPLKGLQYYTFFFNVTFILLNQSCKELMTKKISMKKRVI